MKEEKRENYFELIQEIEKNSKLYIPIHLDLSNSFLPLKIRI
jgi:hypothetical protein